MAQSDQFVQEVRHGGGDGGGAAPVLLHQVQSLRGQAAHEGAVDGRDRCPWRDGA